MRMPGVAVSVAAALLLAALFAGDAVGTALAVLAVAGGWSALALAGRARRARGGLALLAALAATAAWVGLSVAWSVAPDRSWAELDRILVFGGFLAVGLLFGARGSTACRCAGAALVAALGVAVVWALAGKAIPALFPDGGRTARLRDPIGYWNALALAADMLLVLALQLAASARSRLLTGAAAVLAFAGAVAVLLAASRAGVAAAVLGIAFWLVLSRGRVQAALLAAAAVIPAVAVSAWAYSRPALVDDGYPRADRVADGTWLGLLLLLGAALVAVAAHELRRRSIGERAQVRAGRVLASVTAVLVLAGGFAVLAGGGLEGEFCGGEVTNDPGRLRGLSSNNRCDWWGEAWKIARADPVAGAGANTFEVARKRYRETASPVTQPHSVPLQFLAGTGIVGLALFAALVAAVAAAAVGARRRLEGGERDAAAALSVALALWLLHALVDYDWDFVSVTGPALFAAGVLAAAGRPAGRDSPRPLAAVGAAVVALAAVFSVLTPWLAERSVREVGRALDRGDLAGAASSARRAESLDPLALAPLFARARVEERRRDPDAALAAYREAVDLQPENPETWYALGLFEFDAGDRCSAYVHLNEAYTRDPAGRQWVKGGELDEARAWVNAGNCG